MTSDVRIVITGMGALTPLGIGIEPLWEGLLAGRHGIREISAFDTTAYDQSRGGEVPDFEPLAFMPAPIAQGAGRATQLAIAATKQALAQAGLTPEAFPVPLERVGVCLGTTMGEIAELEAACLPGGASHLARYPASHIARNLAAFFDFAGPNLVIPTACSAGNYSLGYAADLLREGRADIMVAGGVDVMAEAQFSGFYKLRSMSSDVPRPFSAGRQGMMVAEGAGILVLERLESALARRAPAISAEIRGYGLSCDAHHMTAPHPEGRGALAAMQAALAQCAIGPGDVDYVSAHGTGTPANDQIESLALERLLGDRTNQVPVTSVKSNLGHTMGAASAIEAIVTALVLSRGLIPGTANYQGPDPDCHLDLVTEGSRKADVGVALSNSYAFGGNNSCLVLGRC